MAIVGNSPSEEVPFLRNKNIREWRPYQKETIERIVRSLIFGDNEFFLLNAPTGSGKSLIAMAVASLWLKYKEGPVIYLTKSPHLLDQLERDFDVPVIKGRKNYLCRYLSRDRDTKAYADACPFTVSSGSGYRYCPLVKHLLEKCEVQSLYEVSPDCLEKVWGVDEEQRCDYLYARERARMSSLSVINYHYAYYALTVNRILSDPAIWPRPKLLIIDEAHLFPEFLSEVSSVEIPISYDVVDIVSNFLGSLERFKDKLVGKVAKRTSKDRVDFWDYVESVVNAYSILNGEIPHEFSYLDIEDGGFNLLPKEDILSFEEEVKELQKIKKVDEVSALLSKSALADVNARIVSLELASGSILETIRPYIHEIMKHFATRALKGLSREQHADLIQFLEDLKVNPDVALSNVGEGYSKLFEEVLNKSRGALPQEAEEAISLMGWYQKLLGFYQRVVKLREKFEKVKDKIFAPNSPRRHILAEHLRYGPLLQGLTKDDLDRYEYVLILKAEYTSEGLDVKLALRSIFPRNAFKTFWERMGSPKVLFMSATLIDDLIIAMLGLDSVVSASRVDSYEVPSTFPPSNRPIIYVPYEPLSRDKLQGEFGKKYVKVLDKFLSLAESFKGIIHVVSWRDYQLLREHSTYAHKFVWAAGSVKEKNNALSQFQQMKGGFIVSPSMWEGVDLKDDLSRFQVIFKVPFPSLGDLSVLIRKQLLPSWYRLSALNTIVQGAGRSVRSEKDWAVTIILDSYFGGLSKWAPRWFREAVQKYDSVEDALEDVKKFLEYRSPSSARTGAET